MSNTAKEDVGLAYTIGETWARGRQEGSKDREEGEDASNDDRSRNSLVTERTTASSFCLKKLSTRSSTPGEISFLVPTWLGRLLIRDSVPSEAAFLSFASYHLRLLALLHLTLDSPQSPELSPLFMASNMHRHLTPEQKRASEKRNRAKQRALGDLERQANELAAMLERVMRDPYQSKMQRGRGRGGRQRERGSRQAERFAFFVVVELKDGGSGGLRRHASSIERGCSSAAESAILRT